MAVTLYKQGTTHTIRGTLCEMGTFHPEDIHSQLKSGWFTTPEEAYSSPEEPEEKEVLNFEYMSNVEIRDAAKKAGLEKWDTARIETLKEALV